MNAAYNDGTISYSLMASAQQILLQVDGEVAGSLSITATQIATSGNAFTPSDTTFFTLTGADLVFSDNLDSERQQYGADDGLEFDDASGTPVASLTAAGNLTVQSCVGCGGGTVSGTATHIPQFTSSTAVGDTGFVDGTVSGLEAMSITAILGGTETFQTTFGSALDPWGFRVRQLLRPQTLRQA